MLCQFSVKNYRSIKEEVTLDMQAAAITEHRDHLLTDKGGEDFLPVAVIYGPNGGGKSNVLRALNVLLIKLMAPICAACPRREKEFCPPFEKIRINPFKFCEESLNSPTEFEIFFRTDKSEYRYNIQILNEEVVYESLYKKDTGKTRTSKLFVRDINAKIIFSMGIPFNGIKIPEISKTLPLLSYLMMIYSENKIVHDILLWVERGIMGVNFADSRTDSRINILMIKKEKEVCLKMLKNLDIDIENYEVLDKGKDKGKDILTDHNVNGKITRLDLNEESSGTIKLFSVLPELVRCLFKGATFIADELDSKLHPKLLKYIIELFTDKHINTKNAQLIFTSHDLSTMTSDIFRRDEIWFAAKNAEQATSLYSLVEFKDKSTGKSTRKDANFNKQYLEGRYGADPYLRKMIDWEAVSSEN